MRKLALLLASMALSGPGCGAGTGPLPAAIYTDPAADSEHPARMETLHIPSGGVEINGLAYIAAGNAETLADTSPERMADELSANRQAFDFLQFAPALAGKSLLVLSADDRLAPLTDALVDAVREQGGARITAIHEVTDHAWSDKRIALQAHVIRWLETMAETRE
ncbi:MAG: hypothetical protein WC692_08725 [Erythrobacter sp.]|jgi:hypothetical protein